MSRPHSRERAARRGGTRRGRLAVLASLTAAVAACGSPSEPRGRGLAGAWTAAGVSRSGLRLQLSGSLRDTAASEGVVSQLGAAPDAYARGAFTATVGDDAPRAADCELARFTVPGDATPYRLRLDCWLPAEVGADRIMIQKDAETPFAEHLRGWQGAVRIFWYPEFPGINDVVGTAMVVERR